jgi:hypothetical protein
MEKNLKRIKLLFITVLLTFSLVNLYTQELSIKTTIPETVISNQAFKIVVEVTGGSSITILDVPDTETDITIKHSGTMSSFSYVNGVYTSSQTLTFYARINSEGEYKIGSFRFKIGSSEYTTEEKTVTVTKPESKNDGMTDKNNTINPDRHYYLSMDISSTDVFVNEYIDITIYFYSREPYQRPSYQGLDFPRNAWVEDMRSTIKRQDKTRIGNLLFNTEVAEIKRLYISRPGTYTLPPVTLDFYGVDLNNYHYLVPKTLSINETVINVKPLPENAPDGFSGAVGQFTVSGTIQPQKLKVKEPANLQLTVTGSGNFHNMGDIGYRIDDNLEEYSSKSTVSQDKTTESSKTWEILLVPERNGKYRVDVNDFVYFDPIAAKYQTIRGESFYLDVVKGSSSEDNTLILLNNNENDTSPVDNLSTIRYITITPGRKHGDNFFSAWTVIIIIAHLMLLIGVTLYLLLQYVAVHRYQNLPATRKRMAAKKFKKGIKTIEKKIECLDPGTSARNLDNFMDSLASLFEIYFRDRFSINSLEFTSKSIRETLSELVSDKSITMLISFISDLDMVRFGGQEVNHRILSQFLTRSLSIIEEIEKENENAKRESES